MPLHVRILAGRVDRSAGSHYYHLRLARSLASRGHRVSLVCFDALSEELLGVEIFSIRVPAYEEMRFLWRSAAWLRYQACGASIRALPIDSPDVVIGGEHLLLKHHWRRFPHVRWIYLPHSYTVTHEIASYGLPRPLHRTTTFLYRSLQRWALRRADLTVRFTEAAAKALNDDYGNRVGAKYAINPMGVDLPLDQEIVSTDQGVRLLFVGRLVASKHLAFAIQSLAGIRHAGWTLDVVGDGPERAACERQATLLGLAERIHFHGHQHDTARWYRQAQLLLFPSLLENCSLTVLEAMAHGVPCLAIKADGRRFFNAHHEVIEDHREGLLAASEYEFKAKLEWALSNPTALLAFGAAARVKVEARFTWTHHLNRYEQLFEQIVGQAAPKRSGIHSARTDSHPWSKN